MPATRSAFDSTSRDFRKTRWKARELATGEKASARLHQPDTGWRAAFITVTFPGIREGDPPFGLSTPVHVVPEGFPHQ